MKPRLCRRNPIPRRCSTACLRAVQLKRLAGAQATHGVAESILDFAMDDEAIEQRLGYTDKRKLDEYLESVREMERRVEVMAESPVDLPKGFLSLLASPTLREHVRLWRT